jgi:hypothetical protein
MKKQTLNLFFAVSLSVLLAAGSASASTFTVRATIPFDFTVGGRTLPAGNYTVSSRGEILLIQSCERRRNASAIALIYPMQTDRSPGASALVFHRYGTQAFLVQVRTSNWVSELGTTPSEREAIRGNHLAQKTDGSEVVTVTAK